jgi:hypothetical protein
MFSLDVETGIGAGIVVAGIEYIESDFPKKNIATQFHVFKL